MTSRDIAPVTFMAATTQQLGNIQILNNNSSAAVVVVAGKITAAAGGSILVLADSANGTVDVGGAQLIAHGGMIETSGAKINGLDSVSVDTGGNGSWLIDPADFNIGGTSSDMSGAALGAALANNSVTILSSQGRTGTAGNVNVNDSINWSADTNLSLSAFNNVNVNANIANSDSKSAQLVLCADNTGIGYTGRRPAGGGTVNFSGSANAALSTAYNAATEVAVYTNPGSYSATDTANVSSRLTSSRSTVYYLVNNLGTASDSVGAHSLGAIENNSSAWGLSYALGQNIDATATNTWNSNGSKATGWKPVGNATTMFSGSFDGQGFTLTGLYIDNNVYAGTAYAGLFGKVAASTGNKSRVSNITLDKANYKIAGSSSIYASGLVAAAQDGVDFGNVAVTNSSITIDGSKMVVGAGVFGGMVADSAVCARNISIKNDSITVRQANGSAYIGGALGRIYGDGWKDDESKYTRVLTNASVDGLTINSAITNGSANTFIGGLVGCIDKYALVNTASLTNTTIQQTFGGGNPFNAFIGGVIGGSGSDQNDYGAAIVRKLTVNNLNLTVDTNTGATAVGGAIGFAREVSGAGINISNSTLKVTSAGKRLAVGGAFGVMTQLGYSGVTADNLIVSGASTNLVNNEVRYTDTSPTSYAAVGGLIGSLISIAKADLFEYKYPYGFTDSTGNKLTVSANATLDEAYAGGAVGYSNWGVAQNLFINNSSVSSSTGGIGYAGGLYGWLYGGDANSVVKNSTINSYADVQAYAGGAVGRLDAVTYKMVSDSNTVTAASNIGYEVAAGGLIGDSEVAVAMYDSVLNATVTATINGEGPGYHAVAMGGGFSGRNNYGNAASKPVGGNYFTNSVDGANITVYSKYGSVEAGGYMGENDWSVTNYAVKNILINSSLGNDYGSVMLGGVAGYNAAGLNSVTDMQSYDFASYPAANTRAAAMIKQPSTVDNITINVTTLNNNIYLGGGVGYQTVDYLRNVGTCPDPLYTGNNNWSLDHWVIGGYYLGATNYTGINISAKSVNGNIYAGGAVGYNDAESIANSVSNSSIAADSTAGEVFAGGVHGYLGWESESDGINNVSVIAHGSKSAVRGGGIAGYAQSAIREANVELLTLSATSDSASAAYAGGVAGEELQNWDDRTNLTGYRPQTIDNSVKHSSINAASAGTSYAGGIYGKSAPYSSTSYRAYNPQYDGLSVSASSITARATGAAYAGGLFGEVGLMPVPTNSNTPGLKYGISNSSSRNNTVQGTSSAGNAFAAGVAARNGTVIFTRADSARVADQNNITATASGTAYAGDYQAVGIKDGYCGSATGNNIMAQVNSGSVQVTHIADGTGVFALNGTSGAINQTGRLKTDASGAYPLADGSYYLDTGADSAVIIGASNATGGMTVNSYGDIGQAAALNISGGLKLNSKSGAIGLSNASNNIDSVNFSAGNSVAITNKNKLTVAGSNSAAGTVLINGLADLVVADTATITSAATGNAITLVVGGDFVTNAANSAFTTASGGRFMIYMVDPLDNKATKLTALSDYATYPAAYTTNVGKNVYLYNNTVTGATTLGGTANVPDGTIINVVCDGKLIGAAIATGGKYSANLTVASVATPFLVFVGNDPYARGGAAFNSYGSGTGLNITRGNFNTYSITGMPSLRNIISGYSNSFLPYSSAGSAIQIASGLALNVLGTSFTIDGNVSSSLGQTYNAALNIQSSMSFNAPGYDINFNNTVTAPDYKVTLLAVNMKATDANNDWGTVQVNVSKNATITDKNAIDLAGALPDTLTINAQSVIEKSALAQLIVNNFNFTGGDINLPAINKINNFNISANNVNIYNANAINLNAGSFGTLILRSKDVITQTGAISVSGTTSLIAADINLANPANDFGTVTATISSSTGNLNLADVNTINLGSITANTLNVSAQGITQSAAAKVTGAVTLTAPTIMLTNTGNSLGALGIISGNNAVITNAAPVVLGAVIARDLTINASGTITQADVLKASGTVVLNGTDATLANTANDFGSLAGNLSGALTVADVNGINLGALTAGTANISAAGAITQSAAIKISGTAMFGGTDVTLTNTANDFNTVTAQANGSLTINDSNALNLGRIITNNLGLTAGSVTQSDVVTAPGQMTVKTSSGDVVLSNAANDFGSVTVNSARDSYVADKNNLVLAGSNSAAGSYTAAALGTLKIADAASIAANGSGNALVLSTGNDFISSIADSAISTPNGRFLVYMLMPLNNKAVNLTALKDTAVWPNSYSASAGQNVFLYRNPATGSMTVSGLAGAPDGTQVDIVSEGVLLGTGTVNGGKFTANLGVPAINGAFMVFFDNSTSKGGSVYNSYSSGAAYSLAGSQLLVNNVAGMSDLRVLLGNYTNSYLPYTFTGNDISVAPGLALNVLGTSFNVDGTISTTAGSQTWAAAVNALKNAGFYANTTGNITFNNVVNANGNQITLGGQAISAVNAVNDFAAVIIDKAAAVKIIDKNAIAVAGNSVIGSVTVSTPGDVTLGVGTTGLCTSSGFGGGDINVTAANIYTSDPAAAFMFGNAYYTSTAADGNIQITAKQHDVFNNYLNYFTGTGSHNLDMVNTIGYGMTPNFTLKTLTGTLNNLSYTGSWTGNITIGGTNLTNIAGNLRVKANGSIYEQAAVKVGGDAAFFSGFSDYANLNADNYIAGSTSLATIYTQNGDVKTYLWGDVNFRNLADGINTKLYLPKNMLNVKVYAPGSDIINNWTRQDARNSLDLTGRSLTLNGALVIADFYNQVSAKITMTGSGNNLIINSAGQLVSCDGGMVANPDYTAHFGDAIVINLGDKGSFQNNRGKDAIYFPFKTYDPNVEPHFTIYAGAQQDMTFGGLAGTVVKNATQADIAKYAVLNSDGADYFLVGNGTPTPTPVWLTGTTDVADGNTIDLVSNGALLSTTTVSGGKYSFDITNISLTKPFLLFVDKSANYKGGSAWGSYTAGSSYALGNMSLTSNNIPGMSALRSILGGYANTYLPYSYIGNNITLASGIGFIVNGTSFDIDGNILTNNAAQTYNAIVNAIQAANLTASGSAITFNNAVNATGAVVTFNTGTVTAANAANDFGTVVINATNTANITDKNSIIIAASTAPALTVNAGGAITQSGAIKSTGSASFSGTEVTLNNAANDFGIITVKAGGNASINDANALTIAGANSAGGTYTAAATGALTINTGSTLTAAGSGNAVILSTGGDFTTAIAGSAITTPNGRYLVYMVSPSNNKATGLTAKTDIATYPAGYSGNSGQNVFLYQSMPSSNLVVIGTANVTDGTQVDVIANGVLLGTSTVSAGKYSVNLNVSSLSGAFMVFIDNASANKGGAAYGSYTSGTSYALGSLQMNANNISGMSSLRGIIGSYVNSYLPYSVSGNDINIASGLAFNVLGTSFDIDGNIISSAAQNYNAIVNAIKAATLTATGSAITFNNAVNASGAVVTLNGANVTATNAANDFGTVAVNVTGTANITDKNSIIIAASTAPSLTVKAGNTITQSGAIKSAGAATFSGTDVSLNNTANDFGTLTAAATNNLTITDANALTIAGVNSAGGTYTAAAVGALTINNGSTISANGSGNAVALSTGGDFTTAIANSAITTPNGRFLVYMASPANNKATSLTAKTDSATWPNSYSGNAGQNVFLYQSQPGSNLVVIGTANVADGTQIDVIASGVLLGTSTVSAGKYSVNLNVSSLSGAFMVFIDNASASKGGAAYGSYTSGTSYALSSLQMNANNISSMSGLRGIIGSYVNSYLPYSVSGNDINIASGLAFNVLGTSFDIDGNIATTAAAQNYYAALNLLKAASLTANTSGNLTFNGAVKANSNTLTLKGQAITATTAANDFANLVATKATVLNITELNNIALSGMATGGITINALGDVTLGIGTSGLTTGSSFFSTGNIVVTAANIYVSDPAVTAWYNNATFTATATDGNIWCDATGMNIVGTYSNNFTGTGKHNLAMSNVINLGTTPSFALTKLTGTLNNLSYRTNAGNTNLALGGANLTNIGGNLTINAGTKISQLAALTVAGNAYFNAVNNYALNSFDNYFYGTTTIVKNPGYSIVLSFRNLATGANVKLVVPVGVSLANVYAPGSVIVNN